MALDRSDMGTNVVHLDAKKALADVEVAVVWDQLRDDFIPDGALMDIYVENTKLEQWREFLHWLHGEPYRTEYCYGEQFRSLPLDPEELFQQRELMHLIRIDVGGFWLHCHCFTIEEIELDLDPADINNAGQMEKLVRFLAQLAKAVNADVILTHENLKRTFFLVLHYTPISKRKIVALEHDKVAHSKV